MGLGGSRVLKKRFIGRRGKIRASGHEQGRTRSDFCARGIVRLSTARRPFHWPARHSLTVRDYIPSCFLRKSVRSFVTEARPILWLVGVPDQFLWLPGGIEEGFCI